MTIKRFPPINLKCPHLFHGADYYPNQWQDRPDILAEDMRLLKLAHCNVMRVGDLAWSNVEPTEGRFNFDWLDRTMDELAAHGAFAMLSTVSAARPAWLMQKYPEVVLANADRLRVRSGKRHNHCFTSPVLREKVASINRKMAERYQRHPALLAWHLSNEYGGACHCELCQQAFRQWLQTRYGSLDTLNRAWWTDFASHTFTEWSQIESTATGALPCLTLDWKRFVTRQTVDFMKCEIAALREFTPAVPVTTGMMALFDELDYWKFAPELDIISLNHYPFWHLYGPEWNEAVTASFAYDMQRSLKGGQPFMLIETTPSTNNWFEAAKLKRPGMHRLASVQALAHGADAVHYFQWRKSRGAIEKFYGAVVDHCGHENTRVFREVADVGSLFTKLDPIRGTTVQPEVALVFDWENWWAYNAAQGPRRDQGYKATCFDHYRPFWKLGIPVAIINMDCDFSQYKLLITPMLYMVRTGIAAHIEQFVRAGGTWVTTYWSGIVNDSDLCFLGGFPEPLRQILGIWSEEIDGLMPAERNTIVPGNYEARDFCDLIHAETARVLATYKSDFYEGRPALTENLVDAGKTYYIASRNDDRFHDDFYAGLVRDLKLRRVLNAELPVGVTAQLRTDGIQEFVILLNFQPIEQTVRLGSARFVDLADGSTVEDTATIPAFGALILLRKECKS